MRKNSVGVVAICCALACNRLYAQVKPQKQNETIEVTATNRTDIVQDIPVSVTGFKW